MIHQPNNGKTRAEKRQKEQRKTHAQSEVTRWDREGSRSRKSPQLRLWTPRTGVKCFVTLESPASEQKRLQLESVGRTLREPRDPDVPQLCHNSTPPPPIPPPRC